MHIPVADMNEAVLQAVEEHALTPEAIEQVIQLTECDEVIDQRDRLERERKDIEKRSARLVAAIEAGGEASALVAKLRQLESRQREISADIAGLQPVPRLEPAVIENRLAEGRRLLRQSTTQGRTVLQRVLRGRLTFTPRADGNGYDFTGPTRFDKLFSGVASPRPTWMPRGTSGVENPHDADYGQMLERICVKGMASPRGADSLPASDYVKGVASPTGFEPVFWP